MRPMFRTLLPVCLLSLVVACQGEGELTIVDPDATTPTGALGTGTGTGATTNPGTGTGGGGGCGDVNEWAMTLEGRVVDMAGTGVPFADVRVEERVWHPTTTVMGAGVTNAEGFFFLNLPEIVDVEDCWGTILDYSVVAEQGPRSTERGINTPLFNAIQDGSLAADIADLTL